MSRESAEWFPKVFEDTGAEQFAVARPRDCIVVCLSGAMGVIADMLRTTVWPVDIMELFHDLLNTGLVSVKEEGAIVNCSTASV